jgi:capsid protein
MTTRKEQIDALKERRELASLKVAVARSEFAADRVRAFYDATQPTVKRRTPSTELAGEDKVLPPNERLRGVALTRDLERNYSAARALIGQIKLNVVGSLGKLRVNAAGAEDAAAWFNGVWAKTCSARNDDHWSDVLQLIVSQVVTSGDVVISVDDGWRKGDGKIWVWEADQIASLEENEFKAAHPSGWTQENGVVRDQFGVEMGYYVSPQRGKMSIGKADGAFFVSREFGRLIKKPWRFNQGRGIADMLTSANDLFDLYDMRSRELQSAKVAASMAGKVTRKDGVDNYDALNGSAVVTGDDGDVSTGVADAPNYDRFEALTGGHLEYMSEGDNFELLNIDRPNVNAAEFHDFVLSSAGSALGMARAYSRMRADSSYTAFRGDLVMSWVFFSWLQKWLERRVCDWVAVKVLTQAQATGTIAKLPTGWENSLSWDWPKMPSINPLDEAKADQQELKNGTTDYATLLGPDWRKRMDSLAEQLDYAKAKGLPLSIFETIGGSAPQPNQGE